MEFNDRFTKVMAQSGLTPAEFAEEIGVQRSNISHIISGRNKPSLDFIVKIKSAFPQFEWNWLITGEGEMLVSEKTQEVNQPETEIPEKKKTSLPDLFSMINDENFGYTETDDKVQKPVVRESDISHQESISKKIIDSQALEKADENQPVKNKTVKRIVFFYHDGTFETFEN